jgi:hypothetical protein
MAFLRKEGRAARRTEGLVQGGSTIDAPHGTSDPDNSCPIANHRPLTWMRRPFLVSRRVHLSPSQVVQRASSDCQIREG